MTQNKLTNLKNSDDLDKSAIAIIGMSGRFPKAKNIKEFWQNLQNGVECVNKFSDEELLSSGIDPVLLNKPNYVKANATLSDIEKFDAFFFGFSPQEATIMDPQQRIFLECAWEAIENAGYDAETYPGAIGVYAGVGMNTYLLNNLSSNLDFSDFAALYQVMIGNDKDFLPTRVSFKLNLTGPSVNVQTACSTSLVAVHFASMSLLNGECDMALAGGVSVRVPQKTGYLYQEGMILSPDGDCRAFDAKARGTIGGDGVGIVVLKRLSDAIAQGDQIHAIIKGSAINNDGSLKVGYTAASVEGQAAVISEAQDIAGIDPETISYVEAHGTGTVLGDPIEIAALTKAFRASTQKKGFCAIGSVKTNVGHLDAAAGVTGLIKTVLGLKHQLLPPSLHFEQPNPLIDFTNSPFYVNTKLSEWRANGTPRRAGVSSFGIGGTNAHVVLEEVPTLEPSDKSPRPSQLLVLSAKTSSALDTATANLAEYLKQNPELNLADVAYTLSTGRKAFNHRRVVVCQDIEDAVNALTTLDPRRVFTNSLEPKTRPVVFIFSGQGSYALNMGRELYEVEPTYREQIDLGSEVFKSYTGVDLREVLYPRPEQVEEALKQIQNLEVAQAGLFLMEYALAKLWMEWGVKPTTALGQSIGEYVAACLAGVFSVAEGLYMFASQVKFMPQIPDGLMLVIPLSEKELQPLLGASLELATINGPSDCVVAGLKEDVEALQNQLASQGVESSLMSLPKAFHTSMMEPFLEPFTEVFKSVKLQPPQLPYLSCLTGTLITAGQATDPSYWAKQFRQTVQFGKGVEQIIRKPEQVVLEVGPWRMLTGFIKRHPDKSPEQIVLTSAPAPEENQSNPAFLYGTLGQLWLAGVEVDWSAFYASQRRYRVPLPTYPFERQHYWVEAKKKLML